MFSRPDTQTFHITPLGAAVVEAMPDRKKVSKVNRDFTRLKCCPVSELFNAIDILRYYHNTIEPVVSQGRSRG